MNLNEAAASLLGAACGSAPTVVARAPGRVNLIGDHTDYNDGFVFPMAIPFGTAVAISPRTDRHITAVSERFGSVSFALNDSPTTSEGWARYLHGMVWALTNHGVNVTGFDAAVVSDIPGSSLSSSAALEMAIGTALAALADEQIPPAALAQLGQRVEHEVIGVPVGIMDQLISAAGVAGCASLIDCRTLEIDHSPLPDTVRVVVLDTGTRRGLVDSEYAARRAACERVASALAAPALRDVTLADLQGVDLDPTDRRRAMHVITENERTLGAAACAQGGDAVGLGQLMNASHESLHDLFEVTGPAPDVAVRLARKLDGCLGARMTGAGFAGAAVALVETDAADHFVAEMTARFVAPPSQPSTEPPAFHVVWPVRGAHVVQPTA